MTTARIGIRRSPIRKASLTASKGKARGNQERRASVLPLKLGTTQRDIFDWYEKKQYSDDAGEVFSPEWQDRLDKWGQQFDCSIDAVCKAIESSQHHPQDLELGLLFQAHPIAGFSLWHMLQTCYELDMIICGPSTGWQILRPFQYLQSKDVLSAWKEKLRSLSAFYVNAKRSTNKFEKEKVASRLHTIARGVNALEESLGTLTNVFEGKREDMSCSYWMLEVIQESVDRRCEEIWSILDPNKTQQ